MSEFIYIHFMKLYGKAASTVSEWTYSILDGLERYEDEEPHFRLFKHVLLEEVGEALYYDEIEMLEVSSYPRRAGQRVPSSGLSKMAAQPGHIGRRLSPCQHALAQRCSVDVARPQTLTAEIKLISNEVKAKSGGKKKSVYVCNLEDFMEMIRKFFPVKKVDNFTRLQKLVVAISVENNEKILLHALYGDGRSVPPPPPPTTCFAHTMLHCCGSLWMAVAVDLAESQT